MGERGGVAWRSTDGRPCAWSSPDANADRTRSSVRSSKVALFADAETAAALVAEGDALASITNLALGASCAVRGECLRIGACALGVIAATGFVGYVVSAVTNAQIEEDNAFLLAMTVVAAVAAGLCVTAQCVSTSKAVWLGEGVFAFAYLAVCVLGLAGYAHPAIAATEQLALTLGVFAAPSLALRGGLCIATGGCWAGAWLLRPDVFAVHTALTPCMVVVLAQVGSAAFGGPVGACPPDHSTAAGTRPESDPAPPPAVREGRASNDSHGSADRPGPLRRDRSSLMIKEWDAEGARGTGRGRSKSLHSDAGSASYFIAPVPPRFDAADDSVPTPQDHALPGMSSDPKSQSAASLDDPAASSRGNSERTHSFSSADRGSLVRKVSDGEAKEGPSTATDADAGSTGSTHAAAGNFSPENHRVSFGGIDKLPPLPQPPQATSRWSFIVNNLNNVMGAMGAAKGEEQNRKDIRETSMMVKQVVAMTAPATTPPRLKPLPNSWRAGKAFKDEDSFDGSPRGSLADVPGEGGSATPLVRTLQTVTHTTLERLLLLFLHLSEELDIFRINRFVCACIVEVLQCERSSIFLCDWQNNVLWTFSEDGHHIRVAMDNSLAGYSALHNETLTIQDAYRDTRHNKDADKNTGYVTRNLVVSPISRGFVEGDAEAGSPRADTKVFAVVEAINKRGGGAFTKQDEGILALLGKQAGVHLLNAQVYQQLQVEGNKTQCLLEVSKDINDVQMKLGEMMAKIMMRARQVLTVERASIFLIDGAKQELWSILTDSETAAQLGGDNVIRFPVGVGLAGHVARHGQVLNIDDAYSCDLFNPEFDKKTGFKTKSTLCVPVRNSAKTFGVIQFINKANGEPFHDGDIELAMSFSSFVGVSLNNVQLVDELREGQLIREKNRELMRLRDQAKQAAEAKNNFLMSMSHEIRTPMTGVIGMCELLTSTKLTTEQKEMTDTIRSCGEALMAIINDVLDFGRLDAGKLQLEHTPFMLISLLEETIDVMRPKTEAKHLTLLLDVDGCCEVNVLGDQYRLRQVLTNLVGNAVKFTPDGGDIVLKVRKATAEEEAKDLDRTARECLHAPLPKQLPAAAGSSVRLYFGVTDTGIGVDDKAQKRLFRPFEQADAGTTRQYGGSGLGLAICKQLVDAMGGSIGIVSRRGEGSTFAFTAAFGEVHGEQSGRPESPRCRGSPAVPRGLPRRVSTSSIDLNFDAGKPDEAPTPQSGSLRGLQSLEGLTPTVVGAGGTVEQYLQHLTRGTPIGRVVLLCCTHAGHRRVLAGLFMAVGAVVWWVDDFAALPALPAVPHPEAAAAAAAGTCSPAPTPLPHLPYLLLIDRDSSNFEQAGGMLHAQACAARYPVLKAALLVKMNDKASLDLNDDRVRVCTKPVKMDALMNLIADPAPPQGDGKAAERSTSVLSTDRRLLIAEDNPTNQLVIKKQLTSFGVTPTICGNGQEAVDALLRGRYDLVLMDCHMPVLDGYGATQKIRELEGKGAFLWKEAGDGPICVIALTADALPQTREHCLDSGMDDYLTKPLKKQTLKQTLDTYFFV